MTQRKHDPNYPNAYASGGHKEPLSKSTDGQKFRVRDDDQPPTAATKVWGKDLSYDAARKLTDKLAGSRKTTRPLIENQSVQFPPLVYVQQVQSPAPTPPPPPAPTIQPPPNGQADLADLEPIVTESADADLDSLIDEAMS